MQRRKNNHVVFLAQIVVARDGLRVDVVVRHAEFVERHAPPAFGLRVDPRMHQRDARCGEFVGRHIRFRRYLTNVQTRVAAVFQNVELFTFPIISVPAPKCWPSASNAFSATAKSASFIAYRNVINDVSP